MSLFEREVPRLKWVYIECMLLPSPGVNEAPCRVESRLAECIHIHVAAATVGDSMISSD